MKTKTTHRLVIGDARSMRAVDDKSIHLIVTSPPYWQLKDYGTEEQIGFDDSYEKYVNNLNLTWMECYRVLHDGCRLCVNIGDQFARSVYYGRYKVIPIRTEITRFCESIGFDFMGSIIWQKVTTCNTTGGASIMGSFPYPRNGIVKIDYEFILLFKKRGKAPTPTPEAKKRSAMTTEEWNLCFNGHWNFPGERQGDHLAAFPLELPKRLIRMFSFDGETVLDPFCGSGTTMLASLILHRNSIGYEINTDFRDLVRSRLQSQVDIFSDHDFAIEVDSSRPTSAFLDKLPYIFNDPVLLDKKTDPRKLNFGSRVSKSDSIARDFFKVKDVIAPNEVLLDNDIKVVLAGIKPKVDRREEALLYLRSVTIGQQVFLKYGSVKYDAANGLLAYLYLKNKTFINAHLVRRGYAEIDETTGSFGRLHRESSG